MRLAKHVAASPSLDSLPSIPVKRARASTGDLGMGCNFPEILAHDLAMSEAVFSSKHLTAGAPHPDLAGRDHGSLPGDSGSPVSRTGRYHKALSTIRSLGELEEWSAKLDSLERESGRLSPDASQVSDSTSESSSAAIYPPCVGFREPSVTTAPTSITSRRCSSPLRTTTPETMPTEKTAQGTWVDLEPDAADRNSQSSLDAPPGSSFDVLRRSSFDVPLSDKIRLGPGSNFRCQGDFCEGEEGISEQARKNGSFMMFDLVGCGPPERPHTSLGLPSTARLGQPDIAPVTSLFGRRPSLLQHVQHAGSGMGKCDMSKSSSSTAVTTSGLRDYAAELVSPLARDVGGALPSSAVDQDWEYQKEPLDRARVPPMDVVGSFQANPAVDVQGQPNEYLGPAIDECRPPTRRGRDWAEPCWAEPCWAEPSTGIDVSPQFGRHVGRSAPSIPLPPEVVETLRVSVVCFPETMLVSSSLTIETIRNYSSKFRHEDSYDGHGAHSILSSRASTVDSSRKRFKLRGLISSKKTTSSRLSKPTPAQSVPCFSGAASGALAEPDWSSLRNIFPLGSDYLCDALYAHLIAYNYISSLCEIGSPADWPGQAISRNNAAGVGEPADTGGEEASGPVPTKAASLLGISGVGVKMPISHLGVFRRKKPSPGGRPLGPSGYAGDLPMREIQVGLAKCISRLVAMLKLAGHQQPGLDHARRASNIDAAEEVDPLLLRALCEVVQCSEKAR